MNVRLHVKPWPIATERERLQALHDKQVAAEFARRVKANEMRRLLAVITHSTQGQNNGY